MRRTGAPSQLRRPFVPPSFKSPATASADNERGPFNSPLYPQQNLTNPPLQTSSQNLNLGTNRRYFSVVWAKVSGRKHKKFEDDALMMVDISARLAVLKDESGKEIARGSGLAITEMEKLESGGSISFGGKEIEIQEEIDENRYKSSKSSSSMTAAVRETENKAPAAEPDKYRPKVISKTVFRQFSVPMKEGYRSPNVPEQKSSSLYNADAVDALVLPRPPFNPYEASSVVDVVVDPHLSRLLRPHQRQGVIFLYRCLMGFNDPSCYGAILADEMGLGKTLQTITLIWTLLKQGPRNGSPVIKKVLILAPSSLVKNWEKEFSKWLGTERIRVCAVDTGTKVTEYVKYNASHTAPILIMSYEMFVRSFEDLLRISFDLVVCDEGHRLKNDKIKASTLLSQLETDRKIVLTGTPLQNDLKEFYAIVSLVNPNVLGSSAAFYREFEEPIVRSKQPEASEDEIEAGSDTVEKLTEITRAFILRRTQDLLSKYLPPKSEYVLFCKPTQIQSFLYESVLDGFGENLSSINTSCVFSSMAKLRKICNHPAFITIGEEAENFELPEEYASLTFEEQGSKLAAVSLILHHLRQKGNEKIVLVSISTQVLDLLEELCSNYGYPSLRLDGSTSPANRQSIVTRFNSNYGDNFVLLLSSKAGGTGLNLIGASRILLYDMDWNPAHDIQAMARVWRDGQTKPVSVYRLATTGTIEEKIFQRQITKQGLSIGVVEETRKSAKFHFTKEDLRDLFTFRRDIICDTHDLLSCECGHESKMGDGKSLKDERQTTEEEDDDEDEGQRRSCQLGGKSKGEGAKSAVNTTTIEMKDLLMWDHLRPRDGVVDFADDILNLVNETSEIFTFAFKHSRDQ